MKHQIWIKAPIDTGNSAVDFRKTFVCKKKPKSAFIQMTGLGVYQAYLNGNKISNQVLAPGWTSYKKRVQYETVDISNRINLGENTFSMTVGNGWAAGRIGFRGDKGLYTKNLCIVCEINITYEDGTVETLVSDESFDVWRSQVTFSDIYDGETIDKSLTPTLLGKALISETVFPLIEQVGAPICEQDKLTPIELIITPKGERVIDFGQNMTGYVSLKIKANRGDKVSLSFAEVLDSNGNFYNENYRSAKNDVNYICSGDEDYFKPICSFQGFRYVRLDEYPFDKVDLNSFRAIVVHSDMERLGNFVCGDKRINQLYHNLIWGQKSNYLDIPTDCPQRDERLGWTGDAQVFCRTAALNFDVKMFFKKWLGDLRLEQGDDGAVYGVCPQMFSGAFKTRIAAGWGDVATIAPYTLYEIYGDESFFEDNFEMMKKWVEYQRAAGNEEFLWLTGDHYGDWLAMDAGADSYVGATSNDLIATAFYANSVRILVRSGEILGKDMTEYKLLYENVKKAFREYFMENGMPKEEFPLTEITPEGRKLSDSVRKGVTQTAIVLILYFELYLPEERDALVQKLCELIKLNGDKMTTGFIGTPYILHVLSENGKQDVAYKLIFQEESPSWLYSVNHGATTMWEHWNSLKEDGTFWSKDMNSFNHYAYGAVGDWMYGEICGVKVLEGGEGFKRFRIAPKPCERLGFARCTLDTASGRIESAWYYSDNKITFEFTVPAGAEAVIKLPNGFEETVTAGKYTYAIKI